MTDPYDLHEEPELVDPVLVVMLTGWIDAGGAGQLAMSTLEECGADHRRVRPRHLHRLPGPASGDGAARRRQHQPRRPTIGLKAGRDADGHDALLSGHEPDSAWHHFVDSATSLSIDLGAHTMVGLGAYPFATPHTRPSRLSVSAGSADVASGLGYLKNSVDVPAGVQAALEHGFAARGLPAVGLWAQVPHYVSAAAYPPASVALLGGLSEVAGLRVDATVLRTEAERHRSRLDELIASNPEHVEVLRQLEQAYDEEDQSAAATGPLPFTAGDLPSGDELAA